MGIVSVRVLPRLLARVMILAFAVVLVGCTVAPGRVLLSDGAEQIDRAAVEAAAAGLMRRGAVVGVFVVEQGDETGADFDGRLAAAGLMQGGQIAPDAIALYVSYAPRYSELRAGTRWSADLPDATLREVRQGVLNPALRDGQVGAGVADTLVALEERLASPSLLARVLRWAGYLMMAGLALALIAILPLGERIGRLWRRSPPGRLALWLYDQTPGGRARLERITRATRLRLDDRVAYARLSCQAARGGKRAAEVAPLLERLRRLDDERAALDAGAQRGRALEEAMDQLAWDYAAVGHDAMRLVSPGPAPKGKRKRGAASATSSAFIADTSTSSSTSSSSSSDSSTSWDSGSSGDSSGPSSDGGSW